MAILKRRWEVSLVILTAALMLCGAATALADVVNVSTPFYVLDASDGSADGTYNVVGDLTITSTGAITCNDNATDQPPGPVASGASACEIKIHVTGNMFMQAGSLIQAEDQNDGGSGGDITITVDGASMTMCGPAGAQPGCGGPSANDGALISSRKIAGAGDTGLGGDIVIDVGDVNTATGAFYMEGGSTGYGTETGARVFSSGTGPSGDISITAGATYFAEPGSVVEAGGPSAAPSAIEQGGKIFLVSDCSLTSEGRVTSKGPDFGADLVHLEACTVLVRGLVESTGKGHVANAPNSCDLVDDGLDGEVFRDHPPNSTGCVEVWGNFITIDSTLPWAGELNADIGDGGPAGTSWIDIFALSSLTVTDGTGNDVVRDNLSGDTYFSVYAVHANAIDGSDDTPNTITALVDNGPLTASGNAFEASSTMNDATGHGVVDPFVGNGSNGGTIRLEASGNVTLNGASVNASGDFFGGPPCPSGSGACGLGGHIIVSAWSSGPPASNLSWTSGNGYVLPNDSGTIDLNACGTITLGADFHGEVPSESHVCSATEPTIPTITAANGGPVFKTNLWALCGGGTSISGIKFNDSNKNGVRDGSPLEPVIPGWVIHLWNATQTALVDTQATNGIGVYTFPNVADGSYVVCETLPSGWNQSAPVAGPGVVPCTNAGDAPLGYSVEITGGSTCAGQQVTGKDFGNWQTTVTCPEDPNRAASLTRTVGQSQFNGGVGVPGNPKNYATVQSAYNDALISGHAEVIGMFSNPNENLLLNGGKSLTITQCTSARVTGAAGSPVWDITSTGKLLIIGPDSVGGTIGWRVGGGGGHTLKSIRANGASQWGVQINSSNNAVSWNAIDGNGLGGLQVVGGTNDLKGSSVSNNNGDGVQLLGNSNTLSGVSNITSNKGNGVLVTGTGNQVKSNGRINLNTKNGILVTGPGSGNTLSSNASESGKGNALAGIATTGNNNQLTDNKMNSNAVGFSIFGTGNKLKSNNTGSNTGNEYEIGINNQDQTGNKKNGSGFSFGAAGGNFN